MTLHTLGSEARNARILAQRLYGQCRKTASSWRALSPALKHMRNSLEELEDLILDDTLGDSSPAHILISIQTCVLSLRELDRQLQFYRCSAARWQAAISETVAEVSASLNAATTSLLAVCGLAGSESIIPAITNNSTLRRQIAVRIPTSKSSSPSSHPASESHDAVTLPHIVEPSNFTSSDHDRQDTPISATPVERFEQEQPREEDRSDSCQDGDGSNHVAEPDGICSDAVTPLSAGDDCEQRCSEESGVDDAANVPLPESRRSSMVVGHVSDEAAQQSSSDNMPPEDNIGQRTSQQMTEDSDPAPANIVKDSQKLLLLPTADGTLEKPAFNDWRTPFAEIDPLSIDFESATFVLLGTPRHSVDMRSQVDSTRDSSDTQAEVQDSTGATQIVADCRPQDIPLVANDIDEHDAETATASYVDEGNASDTESHITFVDCLSPRLSVMWPPQTSAEPDIAQVLQSPHFNHKALDVQHDILQGNAASSDGVLLAETTSLPATGTSEAMPTDPSLVQSMLVAPTSKFASSEQDNSPRIDSKIDLDLSAPASPSTPSEAVVDLPRVQLDAGNSAAEPTRRASDTTLSVPDETHARPRTSSEPVRPSLDILRVLKQALPSPPPLPPKGRYHIVNPSPRSRSHSLEAAPKLPPRPISPASSRTSGEIPVILVQEGDNPARLAIVDAPESDAASDTVKPANADQPMQQSAKRYYRQDFEATPTMRSNSDVNTPNNLSEATIQEYYSGDLDDSSANGHGVDIIRIDSICHSWHRQEWTRAEAYLLGLVDARLQSQDTTMVRRMRHLLGVSASFQGQWQRAISYFISALQVPLKDASQLDEGDRAALIWLSDCYIMSNRRLEAYIASALASQGLSVQKEQPGLLQILQAEQKAILGGGSKAQLELKWTQLTAEQISQAQDTIINDEIVSPNLIEICFNQPTGKTQPLPKASTIVPRNRATVLCELDNYDTPLAEYLEFQITPDSFDKEARWPMPYDPFFAAEQAAKGRLCDQPCDLLAMVRATPQLKIPKSGPLGSSRFDCFSCGELEWLVRSVRDCLNYLEMKWDEVASTQGIWFTARFAMKHRNVLTANYFAISLYKQTMRHGYGIEVCVDGVRSARAMHLDSPDYPMGVHFSCEKRLKKFFKDYLSRAHRLWIKNGKPSTSVSAIEVASGDLAKEADSLVAKGMPVPAKAGVALYA